LIPERLPEELIMRVDKKIYTDIIFVLLIIYGISITLSISVTNIVLGLLIISCLIRFILEKRFFCSLEGLPLLFLFIYRIIWVKNLSNWLKCLEYYGGKFWDHLPYFIIPNLRVKKIKIIIYVTLVVASLTALFGIVQFFGDFDYPFMERQFVEGHSFLGLNFRNRLHSGGYYSIITIVSFVFFCYFKENRKTKFAFFVFSLLNFIAVLLTFARTYYVATLLTISIILLRKRLKWLIIGSVLISILFFAPLKISHEIRDRVVSIVDTKQNPSNVERLWMWKTALKIIKKHPFIGGGYGSWSKEVEGYFKNEKGEEPLLWLINYYGGNSVDEETHLLEVFKGDPHNAYLKVTVESGLIGLVLLLLFWIGNSIASFLRARLLEKGTVLYTLNVAVGYSIIMLLIGAFFEHNLTTARLLLPITFLMGLSYVKSEVEDRK